MVAPHQPRLAQSAASARPSIALSYTGSAWQMVAMTFATAHPFPARSDKRSLGPCFQRERSVNLVNFRATSLPRLGNVGRIWLGSFTPQE
jgi:hypothetical protein